MKLIYTITIWLFIFLGLGHCIFTFKKYATIEANSLWFFSAALGVIFGGLINYINLKEASPLTNSITLGVNVFQLLFYCVLAYNIQKPIIFVALIFAFLLLVFSIINK
jgi:hypothetical protein